MSSSKNNKEEPISMYTRSFLGDKDDVKEVATVPNMGVREIPLSAKTAADQAKKPATIKRSIILPAPADQFNNIVFMSVGGSDDVTDNANTLLKPAEVVVPQQRNKKQEFPMKSIGADRTEFTCRMIENCSANGGDINAMQRQMAAKETIERSGRKFNLPTYAWFTLDKKVDEGGGPSEVLAPTRAIGVFEATIPAIKLQSNAAAVFGVAKKANKAKGAQPAGDDNDGDAFGESKKRKRGDDGYGNDDDNDGWDDVEEKAVKNSGMAGEGLYWEEEETEAEKLERLAKLVKEKGENSTVAAAAAPVAPNVAKDKSDDAERKAAEKLAKKKLKKEEAERKKNIDDAAAAQKTPEPTAIVAAQPPPPTNEPSDVVTSICTAVLARHKSATDGNTKQIRLKDICNEVLKNFPDFGTVKAKSKDEQKTWVKAGTERVKAVLSKLGYSIDGDSIAV